jgi:rhodanese-related sulfurtransferase
VTALTICWAPALSAQPALTVVETAIELAHPVRHITADTLAIRLIPDSNGTLLFDVRRLEEYETSHLADAIHIDPEISVETFLERYGATVAGRNLVFYCSVGYRSSFLLERVQKQATAAGALSLANLRGGIFRWYNSGHTVVDQDGITDRIHPYDGIWGRLIEPRTP